MSKPQLKKATITVLDGADKDKVITVLFNPTEYSFERVELVQGDAGAGPGRAAAAVRQRRVATSSAWSCSSTTTPIPQGPTSLQQKEIRAAREAPAAI